MAKSRVVLVQNTVPEPCIKKHTLPKLEGISSDRNRPHTFLASMFYESLRFEFETVPIECKFSSW